MMPCFVTVWEDSQDALLFAPKKGRDPHCASLSSLPQDLDDVKT